ncbi:carbon catabolite repressor protein [Trifolium repens]|jgi:hypothetical protein|nr:carbon catabolite repressor protein [Trifolium repens]
MKLFEIIDLKPFTDYTLRQLVEPLPQGCSFTFMADSCCSGALLEGATEIIGNSTRFPVTDKLPPPMTEHVDKKVVDPTNCRKLGILVSACQSGEVIGSKYCAVRKKNVSYFTNTLISTIKKFGVNISNKFLVEEITKVYAEEGITRASPGLYCDESQINLKLLSLEEVDNQPSSSHQIEEE